MSEPVQRPVDANPPPEREVPDAAAAPFLKSDGTETEIGERWNRFTLRAVYAGAPYSYLAEDAGNMDKVLITARLVGPGMEWRRRAWAQLCAITQPKLVRCIEAIEEKGWRYEIMAAPPPNTLREWLTVRRPGFEEVEEFVRQLAPALDALHGDGLVHLNLRPEIVHFAEGPAGPEFVIAGLHAATLFQQPELIPIEVDPFYAPPEAAGLAQHPPGPQLGSWDWWSLGRVVQELLLGHHVLGVLLRCDVSNPTPELRARAEQLLLEREPTGVRAGAIEEMEAEPAALPLLRGLLSSCADGRWRGDSVQRWLNHEVVRDFYDQPRGLRLWSNKGRVFTVRDAVEFFTQPANWADGEDTLMRANEPGTFAHFLRDTAGYREDWGRLRAAVELASGKTWADVPPLARRTLTTAAGWLALSVTPGSRPVFRIRGHGVDNAGLSDLLKHPGGAEGVALVRAVLLPAVTEYIESLDSVAGRVLKGVATRAGPALALVLESGWLDSNDQPGLARFFMLALQRITVLQERVTTLQVTYATSRYPELARILASKAPTPVELLVLAFAGETPEQCGFVTHADHRNERYQTLKTEIDALTGALRWVQLERVLRQARLWGARWPVFVGAVVGTATAIGVLDRSIMLALLVAAALAGSRAWMWWRVRNALHRHEPMAPPWDWRDGTERAIAETQRVLAPVGAKPGDLAKQLHALRALMAEFAEEARRDPAASEEKWLDVRTGFALSAAITLAAFGQALAGVHAALQSEELPKAVARAPVSMPAQSRLEHADGTLATELVDNPEALLATGHYELVDDGFGRRLRGPLQRWDLFSPPEVPILRIQERLRVSAPEAAFARVTAELQLRPYVRDSVKVLLAIQVPAGGGAGLVIYNSRDRRLLDREVRVVMDPLQERTWYALDGLRVLYLGNRVPAQATNSLAPP